MTKATPLPSQAALLEMLTYCPMSGRLHWRSHSRRSVQHNARWAGAPAGNLHPLGYLVVRTGGRRYLAHRLIWKMVHGTEPGSIDHRNGDGTDNRLCNLRACSHAQNMRNTAGWARKHLPKGVHLRRESGRYRAIICVDRTNHTIGTFATIEEAAAAYAEAAARMHGEFARVA